MTSASSTSTSRIDPNDGLSRDGIADKWTADRAAQDGWILEDIGAPRLSDLAGLPLRDLVQAFGEPEVDNG